MNIETFDFKDSGLSSLKSNSKGSDWPVVYLIYNDKSIYIGETTSASTRMGQHLNNKDKQEKKFKSIKIVFDDTFNKSVVLDYEQRLIKLFKSDKKYSDVSNRNPGQSDKHDYYQREMYDKTFEGIWEELVKQGLANEGINEIKNKNLFKFSPWSSLTNEQRNIEISILQCIYDCLINKKKGVSLVNGSAGTGKTVLAINIINSLINCLKINEEDLTSEEKEDPLIQIKLKIKDYVRHTKPLKIGFVFPMTGIRSVIEKVFKEAGDGFTGSMVISPSKIKGNDYDVVLVDEAHRLSTYKNIGVKYNSFKDSCDYFGLDIKTSNQLDWALLGSKYTILFYDKDQSISSSDLSYNQFNLSLNKYGQNIEKFQLTSQMRCEGGKEYIDYVKNIMNCTAKEFLNINNYEFYLYEDVNKMINDIRVLDNKEGKENNLCKTVAGYSWDWKNKPDKTPKDDLDYYNKLMSEGKYDIDINGNHYLWNFTTENWIPRKDSHFTIGCIHTTQGFDLNYVGLIFGKEIDYNKKSNQITIDLNEFKDKKVKMGCDVETIKTFIINTYTTMLARGIKGCYVYAYNRNLFEYLKKYIKYKY